VGKLRLRSENIRQFIIQNIELHPKDITNFAANHFGISRQAINKHLQKLVAEKILTTEQKVRTVSYGLSALVETSNTYVVNGASSESDIWGKDVRPALGSMPDNVIEIWQHGFTEMFNNVIDHSDGSVATVELKKTPVKTLVVIRDNGVGIFKKIQAALNLIDERHAVLELAKGKFTTDPDRHSGEGIFFTSRMFDDFQILSGGVYFSHNFGDRKDWILEREKNASGTSVYMELNNHTARTTRKVYAEYSVEEFRFDKTVVPVKLAQYGDDALVSRSQAKRLLVRIDRFKVVLFDFKGVETVGQAFADEIFRVFVNEHPEIDVSFLNANAAVEGMISRVQSSEPQKS